MLCPGGNHYYPIRGDGIDMKRYKIAARFIFDGFFIVNAETVSNARQKVSDSCGLVLGGGIHTTLPDGEIHWEFPVHPEMSIRYARHVSVMHQNRKPYRNNTLKNNMGEKNHGKFS